MKIPLNEERSELKGQKRHRQENYQNVMEGTLWQAICLSTFIGKWWIKFTSPTPSRGGGNRKCQERHSKTLVRGVPTGTETGQPVSSNPRRTCERTMDRRPNDLCPERALSYSEKELKRNPVGLKSMNRVKLESYQILSIGLWSVQNGNQMLEKGRVEDPKGPERDPIGVVPVIMSQTKA